MKKVYDGSYKYTKWTLQVIKFDAFWEKFHPCATVYTAQGYTHTVAALSIVVI